MSTLFGEATLALTGRYRDPGEQRKLKSHERPRTGPPLKRNASAKERYKPNPFRQPIATADELEFRHMHWQAQRAIVRATLVRCATTTHALDRFDNCGAECLVEYSKSLDRYRLRASYCRCRHCAPCMRAKASLIAGNLRRKLEAAAVDTQDRFRFITLTLRHTDEPLVDQIKSLYRHFTCLRRSKLWKSTQKGGAVTFECRLNDAGEWHPHLHIISEGKFLRQDKLANYWMDITGGSFKVDVRIVKNSKDAANYVSKYVGKGADASVWRDNDKAAEWVTATRGLRSCATFGTWRGFRLLQPDPQHDATDWKPVGLLERICAAARLGDEYNERLLYVLGNALQYDPSRASRKRDPAPCVT